MSDELNIASHVKQEVQRTVQAAGRRRYVRHRGALCSRCLENQPAPKSRYCRSCAAAAMREQRAKARAEAGS